MGQILLGNVSLTIENATESDNGLFCCKLQIKRMSGVQKVTISLKVQPEIPTSPPRRLTMIITSTTTSTRLTDAPKSTRLSTTSRHTDTQTSLVDHISKIEALQNTVVLRPQGEDMVYIMEDSAHIKDSVTVTH
ncbi:hepatitis A virus cellular receptor 1 homolog isoform X1 [Mesocricetus auratus]|uniref:Hepatitis A virus cellular receptor 1 homolog isoform X1 n=2 Tax=Mesocricetus auratus TaxID=10036 RepID=A0ABM2XNX2_MESAU|nr:hepatitis A virus cellular receptor 1 homolog isoform X1 [Mesocricetus auratus]